MHGLTDLSLGTLFCLLCAAVCVHAIKALRLYIALYGEDLSRSAFLRTYCKATPVNLLVPFKLGEFYRMIAFGDVLKSRMKAVVIILLDRFMDTLALLLIVSALQWWGYAPFSWLSLGLLTFLLFCAFSFWSFPGIYFFWNRYLLELDATAHRLWGLKMLARGRRIHAEVAAVLQGRGVILFGLSCLAWMAEVATVTWGLTRAEALTGEGVYARMVQYLYGVLYDVRATEAAPYIAVSCALLIFVYVVVCVAERRRRAS